ncbi:unnamed protein product [Caenorhabditis brenneri]
MTGDMYLRLAILLVPKLWIPPEVCPGSNGEPWYILEFPNFEKVVVHVQAHAVMSGVSQCSISVIYPVLALFLCFEVKKSGKNIASMSQHIANESRIVKENSNWISFWLGVSLALIRLIILKSTSTSLWIARNSIGFLVFLNIAAINIFVSIWVYSGIQISEVSELWTPPGGCPGLKEGYYEQSFILSPGTVEQEKRYVDKYKLYVGISQMSISIIYPVLDLLLFLEIRKSAIRIAQSNHSGALERHHTGRLVLFLSLSYLITCTPTAILWLTQYLVVIKRESILELLIGYGSIFASVLFCLNTISQCVICYLVSSKYRETARMLLGIKEKVLSASLIYPFLALFLYMEIRRSANKISDINHSGSLDRQRTSRMILIMALSYVICSAPYCLIWSILTFIHVSHNSILELLVGYGTIITSIFFCINGISQSVICFLLSSKYRETTRDLFLTRVQKVGKFIKSKNVFDFFFEDNSS